MTWTAEFRPPSGGVHRLSGAVDDEAGRRTTLARAIDPDALNVLTLQLTLKGHDEPIRGFCAAAMKAVIRARDQQAARAPGPDATPAEKAGHDDAMRCFATALTHLESAQMWAIKGVFAPENARPDPAD